MTKEERQSYVEYRLKSAYETYRAAEVLTESNFGNSVVNRLYYSLFYAVNALLVQTEIYTSSHAGIKSQFSQHFIKTGLLDKSFGKLLTELYDWRQKADYDNYFDYDEAAVKPLFVPVLDMIKQIEEAIRRS